MSGWISVKTRKPDDSKAVLVWCPERWNIYAACWTGKEGRWRVFGDGLNRKLDDQQKVTHWMPLPEPPKGHISPESE